MNTLIKVVELIRVSTEDQADPRRAGIQRQKDLNQISVNRHNLQIVETIEIFSRV